ncbi:hypothetical protein QBC36DRAFT_11889 [Triangularia setosa]|uniref:Secreted protein n=1 Tax=Triangularia setosa TaxID=2587417 RepID=A0AAN6W6V0_9PEZI|nr:hypothetical protein QBC36DRAFT_11889 [Podospora setosa]
MRFLWECSFVLSLFRCSCLPPLGVTAPQFKQKKVKLLNPTISSLFTPHFYPLPQASGLKHPLVFFPFCSSLPTIGQFIRSRPKTSSPSGAHANSPPKPWRISRQKISQVL